MGKAKKAMVDAARLADELRSEQDHVSVLSKTKRSLETQMAEMENRLADANESTMRGGKNAMAKLESRIRELEIELGSVQTHTGDNMKAHQKAERKIVQDLQRVHFMLPFNLKTDDCFLIQKMICRT